MNRVLVLSVTAAVLLATAGLTVVLDAWLVERLGANAVGDRSKLFLVLLYFPLLVLWTRRGFRGHYDLAALAVCSGGFMLAFLTEYWLFADQATLAWIARVGMAASIASYAAFLYLWARASGTGH